MGKTFNWSLAFWGVLCAVVRPDFDSLRNFRNFSPWKFACFFSSTLQLAINRDYFPHTLILQSMFQHNYFFTFIRFANCTETHASASKIYLLFKRKDEAFSKRIFRCLRVLFAGEGEAHKNENRFRCFPKNDRRINRKFIQIDFAAMREHRPPMHEFHPNWHVEKHFFGNFALSQRHVRLFNSE